MMWYSSMKFGLLPANKQSIPSTKATMAQAMGKRAERRILISLPKSTLQPSQVLIKKDISLKI